MDRFGEYLRQTGYEVLRSKQLQGIELAIIKVLDPETGFGIKTTVPAIPDS